MLTLRPLVVLILAAALFLSAARSHSAPLASCSNVGFSPGNYTITGTTHKITSSDSIAVVNALSLRPGDAVLFEAGKTWNIRSEANRLKPRTGVLYGRYGKGANPVISANGVTFSLIHRGIIDIQNVTDVTVDGIDVRRSGSENIGIYGTNADDIIIRRLKVSDLDGPGIVLGKNTTNILVEYVEITNVDIGGGPHESLSFDGTDGYVARYNYSHHNGHAGINNKSNAKNGEIYGNEIHNIENDPSLYVERAENLNIHDNWVHTATPSPSGRSKPLFAINVEKLGNPARQYNRNIKVHNNVFETTAKQGFKMWIKDDVSTSVSPIQHNIHFHNNSIVNVNKANASFNNGVFVNDTRPARKSSDWSSNIVENNIIWGTNNGAGARFRAGTISGFTVRNNLYQAGETGGSDLGSNAVFAATAPFVNLAGKDFTQKGAALGAGTNGSNIGAKINWSCGGGSTPNRSLQPLPPKPVKEP